MSIIEKVGIKLDTQSIPKSMEQVIANTPEAANLTEKLVIVTNFLEQNLINGLVRKDMPDVVFAELTSSQSRTIEQVLDTKWGYCTEYAAVAAYMLAMMKERVMIQSGRKGEIKHRYLDVFNTITQKWEIFDPLAILTGKARGNNATLFELEFYRHSQSFRKNEI